MRSIHLYASQGKKKELQVSVEQGTDIDSLDEEGCTPLFYAIRKGRLEIIRFLLQKNATIYIENKDKETPLHAVSDALFRADSADEKKVAVYFQIASLLLAHEKQLREKKENTYQNVPLLKDARDKYDDTPLERCRALAPTHRAAFETVIKEYYPEPTIQEDIRDLLSLAWKRVASFSIFSKRKSSSREESREETQNLLRTSSISFKIKSD